jgi:hypothetical protein
MQSGGERQAAAFLIDYGLAEIDWGQAGRAPYDQKHAGL